jgi:hypothetical protein
MERQRAKALAIQIEKLTRYSLSAIRYDRDEGLFSQYALKLMNSYFFFTATRFDARAIDEVYRTKGRPQLRFILDTNFVFSVLDLHDNPSNMAATGLMELMKKAASKVNTKLYVLLPTVDEMKRSLAKYEFDLSSLRITGAMANAASEMAFSGIAAKYIKELRKTGYRMSAKEYFAPYINNMLDVLRSKGIEPFSDKLDVYDQDQTVIDDVLAVQSHSKERAKKSGGRFREKSYEQIWHDVLLWHVIRDRQNPAATSVLDANVIGITIDYSLLGFDAYKKRINGAGVACFAHPANLIQIMQMFLGASEEFETAIASTLRIPFLVTDYDQDAEKTTLKILSALSRYENIDDIPEATVRHILVNDALRSKMENTENAAEEMELERNPISFERSQHWRSRRRIRQV